MRHFLWTATLCLVVLPQASYGQVKDKKPGKVLLPPPAKVQPSSLSRFNGCTLVFAINGSGESTELTENLREAVLEARAPAKVYHVSWCRIGDPRMDHTDHEAQLKAANRLACLVLALRKDAPLARIILVGNSSGCRVALATAEQLPPGSLDRIFLLSASVSRTYDLVPALRATRGGIDNYFSTDDGVLEMVEEEFGTADGLRQPTAGRVGFCVPRFAPTKDRKLSPDAVAYSNLRQVRWNESMGGNGDHHVWVQERMLRTMIVPQFFVVPMSVPVPVAPVFAPPPPK
jgi:pimeloyl-ACP methyl ester carboxylesterase